MAFTPQINAADRVDRPGPATSEINDGALLAMPSRRRAAELEERRYAIACVHRFAHGGADELLETLGLVAPPPPPKPEPKPEPPARAKRCSRCKETKPVNQFDRNRARGDGLATECKACRTELYEQRRDRGRVIPDALRCAKCQLTKPAAQFSRDKSRSTGLTPQCKDCRNTAKRERLAARRRNAA